MNKHLNEAKIYQRLVAALTQRQLPLMAKVKYTNAKKPKRVKLPHYDDPNDAMALMPLPVNKKFARIDKDNKSLISDKDPNSIITTMELTTKAKANPVYAFSLVASAGEPLPVAINGLDSRIEYQYKDHNESPLAYNPPYGSLPQLATLEPEELLKLANHFSMLKFQYMERGDYWHAWLFGWRQRMIERILEGVATLKVKSV